MAVRYAPAALADLDDIWTYTLRTWGEAQAKRYVREIAAACTAAAAGQRPSQVIDEIRSGYRKVLVNAHVVFFRAGEDGDAEVIRILHQRMDVDRHLDKT